MSDRDDLDRLLQPPVEPLPPPPGAFDRVRRTARRRRWARAAMSAGAAALIVIAGVPGTLFVLQGRDGRIADPPATERNASSSAAASATAEAAPPVATTGGGAAPGRGPGGGPPGGPVPPGFAPESVTFVSSGLGWALGGAPCSDPPCTSVVRTEDGGRGWEGIPAPRTGGEDEPDGVSELRFADPSNGWAYGPGLWSTHDGGATWHDVDVPGGGRVIEAAAAGGWAVAVVSTCGKDPDCGSFRVYGTPAGADRWRPLPGGRGTAGDGVAGVSLTVRGRNAYVAGGGPSGAAIWSGPMDGTGGWVRRAAPCRDGAYPAGITSASDGEFVLVCAGRPGAGGQPKIAYLSGDGGTSWRRGGDVPSGGLVTSVAATPAKIFVATNHGLLISGDGGRGWRRDLAGRGFDYVGFTTDQQGVLVPTGADPGELLFSYDAGRTWSRERFR
ncbi:MAG: hypothetical protein GEV03_22485 [Streptosporangiales bacterium]|nr:hypothetical protein [Streptosporangiales bacterium]